jgi:superfamily II DNA or RNA helicase
VEILKLTKEDEEEILKIPSSNINGRKTYYQKLVVNYFILHKRVLANLFTRAGKSYLTLDAIQRYRTKYQDKICIVAPSSNIIADWKKLLNHIDNIEYYVINSYTIGDVKVDKKYGMFIVDEIDAVCNLTSRWFSTTISSTEYDYFLGLSGTLSKEKLDFLESHGINHSFEIPLKTGYKLGVVPEFITYNIPVELTKSERESYIKANNNYNNQIEFFSKFSERSTAYFISCILQNKSLKYEGRVLNRDQLIFLMMDKLQTTKGNIFMRAKLWREAMMERTKILHHAENKLRAVESFCSLIEGNALIFAYKTDIADLLAEKIGGKSLHSKLTAKKRELLKEEFANKEFRFLTTCKSLDRGYTADVDYIISTTFDSSVERSNQRTGRGMLLTKENADKVLRVINFYVNDFQHEGKKVTSQDIVWLERAQSGQSFVEWINNVNEIR